ncbi:ATP-binding protein [Streptomyces sp. ID05-39B]|uniref:ATP-binding protein n=1 Tax=Streptomyces sp. ID05-39B TaxID=3028664 RepID=UPI0029A073EF|nr:ATP-binding protein [Streptomyces sp. ID05-39B]MDX3530010.1 ATP-binding protein [Streptomyces sp. ID05-39B]
MASRLTNETSEAASDLLPATGRHRTMLFPRRRTTPRTARNFVAATLTEWGETNRLDDIRLCASELVTNAVLHGAPVGRLVLVRVESLDEQLRIEVHDSGENTPTQRVPEESAVDGRGLLIVSTTADIWGVEERTGPGKCVWAGFNRDKSGAVSMPPRITGPQGDTT